MITLLPARTVVACIVAWLLAPVVTAAQTYTEAQADRGGALYADHCSTCHGLDLKGGAAPAVTGDEFRDTWSPPRATVEDLHFILSTTMPPRGVDPLTNAEYLEILAFLLSRNGIPPGDSPIRADSDHLAGIRLDEGDYVPVPDAPEFVEGPNGTHPTGPGPTAVDLMEAGRDADNWLYHTGDYEGTRYSSLDEIDRTNVHLLRPVCMHQFGEQGNFQTGPVVADGVMYLTGPRTTTAIDAASCEPVWRFNWKPLDEESWLTNRGVAVQDGYVVRGTADGYLLAIDAATGGLLWARQIADPRNGESLTMPPMIFDGMILIGPAGSENAISGWVGAFRLSDGEEIWRFRTVPGARREGGPTWGNPEGLRLGGGAVWTPMSLDAERGELYVPVTNPAPDLAPHVRPGRNLYTNSIVALDVRTGTMLWYDQIVPNDFHDWDLTQVSPLFRASVDGTDRDLVTVTGKHGLLHVLDRATHERLFEAEVAYRENADAPIEDGGTYFCPGMLGGVEWNGPALHPDEGVLITPAVNYCFTVYPADTVRHVPGEMFLGGRPRPHQEFWDGYLTATDAVDGSMRWRYESEAPMVAAVTTTGGGLVLTGELTGRFLALDVATGEVLYRFNTGGPMGAGVVTYTVDGRQYIAAASGSPSLFWFTRHPGQGTVVVFALPE